MAAVKLYQQEQSFDTTTYLEKLHDETEKCVADHMAKFYHLQAFEDVLQAAPFAANIVQTLADVSPPCSPGAVPRIGVWSLPMVGPKLQLDLTKMKDCVQADVTEHPGIACHLVILPNTPK